MNEMGRDSHQFAIRRVVVEYGSIPIASWLPHIDSTAALAHALLRMLEASVVEGNRCEPSWAQINEFGLKLEMGRGKGDSIGKFCFHVQVSSLLLHLLAVWTYLNSTPR